MAKDIDPTVPPVPARHQLEPGEVKLVITAGRQNTSRPKELFDPFLPFILAAVVVGGVALISRMAPNNPPPSPPTTIRYVPETASCLGYSYGSVAPPGCSIIAVPKRPTEPGKYLTIENVDAPQDLALTFRYEDLAIIIVKSKSEITLAHNERPIFWPPENINSIERLDSTGPYIVSGHVAIRCGPVVGDDLGHQELVSEAGDLARADITFGGHSPRGPPHKRRKTVYVVGSVQSYEGPAKHGHSQFDTEIVDLQKGKRKTANVSLAATRKELNDYGDRLLEWSWQLKEMAARYHVSEKYLLRDQFWHRASVPTPEDEREPSVPPQSLLRPRDQSEEDRDRPVEPPHIPY
jgi:hypothetical protein